jgi:hypothetical protein
MVQRVMVWSMVWAGLTAWLSAIVMCFTVGPNWESYLEATSSYVVSVALSSSCCAFLTAWQAWFMDALNSSYGGGIWIAIMMMGLNVGDGLLIPLQWTEMGLLVSLVPDHCQREHGRFSACLVHGARSGVPLLRLFRASQQAFDDASSSHGGFHHRQRARGFVGTWE